MVIPGNEIFKLMDSVGLPFDIINILLRERGHAFDVVGFLEAAKQSKNYSKKRITAVLLGVIKDDNHELRELTLKTIERVYETTHP